MEFDRDKLLSALKNGLDLNDCSPEDLENLKTKSLDDKAEELYEEFSEEQQEIDQAYNLTAVGAVRKIGELDFQCTLGNILLLNIIKSPLVSGELGTEIDFEDVVKSLYVLYYGKEAVEPIMDISQRIEDLYHLKPLCKDNPELSEKLIQKVEEISEARTQFTKDAIDFYEEHFTGQELQKVFDQMFSVVSDIITGIDEVDKSSKNINTNLKKKSLDADDVIEMAYPVSKEFGIYIEDVIWNMPVSQVFKLLSIMQRINTEKTIVKRSDKIVHKRILTEMTKE